MGRMAQRHAALAVMLLALGACGRVIPDGGPRPQPAPVTRLPAPLPVPAPAPAPAPSAVPSDTSAIAAGVSAGPALSPLLAATDPRQLSLSLSAFRRSCASLQRRTDRSGLTTGADWQAACTAAAGWSDTDAAGFFTRYFEAVQIGNGRAFATGYYEPEIAGCRAPTARCATPVYRRPADLIEVDLGLFSDSLKGRRIRGKVDGTSFVPYDERSRIIGGTLAGRGLEIAWAEDPIELFFLQIQGSGRLRLPDGGVMRIGYASQNGRDYTGIGKLMKDRGLIQAGSMQDIMAWLRANPVEGEAIMNENKSYVFFQELTGEGPLGALGLPVTPRATVAADPAFVPLGAPVLLSMDRREANGLWIAQDTGGAIKGANRFDTFWGAGEEARTIAGGMSARGTAWLLLPAGTQARLASAESRAGAGAAPATR